MKDPTRKLGLGRLERHILIWVVRKILAWCSGRRNGNHSSCIKGWFGEQASAGVSWSYRDLGRWDTVRKKSDNIWACSEQILSVSWVCLGYIMEGLDMKLDGCRHICSFIVFIVNLNFQLEIWNPREMGLWVCPWGIILIWLGSWTIEKGEGGLKRSLPFVSWGWMQSDQLNQAPDPVISPKWWL